jgi:hypothetical protein
MVGFGLFKRLEDRLFLKIILFGGHHEKELVELNNMSINFYFCLTLALNAVLHVNLHLKATFAKQYNHIKEK